ncbi:MAG: DUF6465 family protein [Clostridiales bacterium]|nr:DUF6465 family protein [Clostridiales bacterium]
MTKVDLFIEFNGKKVDQKAIVDKAKETWKAAGNKMKDLSSVELYYQPDAGKCYYVFNGESTDNNSFEI